MNTLDKELELATDIAKRAGEIMLKYFETDQQVEIKSDDSLVTIADKQINSMVIESLMAEFPEDKVIGEEESTTLKCSGRVWFCDPIDGTSAFVHNVPTAMFSLALVVDGKPQIGVAYDPFLNKLYTAKAGDASYCNGEKLAVSRTDLSHGVVAVTGSVKSILSIKSLEKMVHDNIHLYAFSGAVYKSCLVAKGKLVAYVEPSLNAYDIAAAHLIVECAGGKVTSMDGTDLDYSIPFKGAIISNGVEHERLVEYFK